MLTKISYLGLGTMGGGMAPNLSKAGYELTVWNRSAEKCESFARKGVRVADAAIRSILIFDNHPDSLRLVSRLHASQDVDLAAPRYTSRSHVIIGLVVMIALAFAIAWPLL
jgi:predicted dinucleotide-binding enzyme